MRPESGTAAFRAAPYGLKHGKKQNIRRKAAPAFGIFRRAAQKTAAEAYPGDTLFVTI